MTDQASDILARLEAIEAQNRQILALLRGEVRVDGGLDDLAVARICAADDPLAMIASHNEAAGRGRGRRRAR